MTNAAKCLVRANLRSFGATVRVVLPVMLLMGMGAASAIGKPNVLFIAVDDLRPELGCYHQHHVHTPNIDRLAENGVLFDHAYCQYPVCNASRASVLTGLRPNSTGVFNNFTQFRTQVPDAVTLPQHFKNNGYVTQAFGKIFHGAFERAYVGRTFDDPMSWSEQPWYGAPQYYYTEHGITVAREVFATKFRKAKSELGDWKSEFVQGLATEAPDVQDEVLYDGQVTEQAIRALGQIKDRPFFLAVGYLRPHLPFVAPKKYWDLYERANIRLPSPAEPPPNAPTVALVRNVELRVQYTDMLTQPLTETQVRTLRQGYYACVSYIDSLIGRLLDELDRLGLRDDTVIVLWGDHGYHLGEQDCWGKLTAFELAVRVPLIVSAPGQNDVGARSGRLVELIDVYPTICELAELPCPPHLEGTSFVPLLDRPGRPWKDAAFTQVVHGKAMGSSIRTESFRFTRWQNDGPDAGDIAIELYDYRRSPIESNNIAYRPQNAALVQELTVKLEVGLNKARIKRDPKSGN